MCGKCLESIDDWQDGLSIELVKTGSFQLHNLNLKNSFKLENIMKMKKILLITSVLISPFSFANYALIQDADGEVNVRAEASAQSKIIGKLNNGEVVSIIEDLSEHHFNYVINDQLPDQTGYIYESRLNPFKGFQKWTLDRSTNFQATYRDGKNIATVSTEKAQINPKDFKFGPSPKAYQRYKNKPFFGTDGTLPTESLQLKNIEIQYNGQKFSIPAQDLQYYFLPATPLSQGGLQDFAEAEIYSKGNELYFINTLAGGGAMQYTLVIHIKNGKVLKIQAWNESI